MRFLLSLLCLLIRLIRLIIKLIRNYLNNNKIIKIRIFKVLILKLFK